MEYVYIIHAEGTDWFKIGRSNNPNRRNKEVAAKAPYETKVVVAIPTPESRALELYMHDQYDKFRVRGEWFAVTGYERDALIGCYSELVRDNPTTGVTMAIVEEFFDIPF